MGTLLAMIFSMSMMAGCSHPSSTASNRLTFVPPAPALVDVVVPPPAEPPCEASTPATKVTRLSRRGRTLTSAPVCRRTKRSQKDPNRWVPEPVPHQGYLNSYRSWR